MSSFVIVHGNTDLHYNVHIINTTLVRSFPLLLYGAVYSLDTHNDVSD
jgi:hypothetical protein